MRAHWHVVQQWRIDRRSSTIPTRGAVSTLTSLVEKSTRLFKDQLQLAQLGLGLFQPLAVLINNSQIGLNLFKL